MKKIFAILGTLILLTAPARAGLLLEPYLTYETSTVSASVVDMKNKGNTTIGGRIGYKLLIPVWFAADLSTGSGKYEPDLPAFSTVEFKRQNMWGVVGFDFPILFRAWLGIGLANKVNTTTSGTDTEYKGGSSQKLGVGISFLPMISMNLEYFTNKPDLPTGVTKFEETGLQLGLSVPLDL